MDDNKDLLARLLMGQGPGPALPSPLSRLMSETIVPRQPGREDAVRRMLDSPADWSGVATPGLDDTSMSPVNMAMGLLGGPTRMGSLARLPTDFASRQARAQAQGFTIDAYKGMNPYKPESLPDVNWKGQPVNGTGARVPEPITEGQGGRFYSSDPAVASRFAEVLSGGPQGGASVFPVKLRMENPKVIDAQGQYAADFQFGPGAGRLKLEPNSRHDGVILKNTKDEGDVFIPREGNQVRSRWAMFDPENIASKSLLGSLLGLVAFPTDHKERP